MKINNESSLIKKVNHLLNESVDQQIEEGKYLTNADIQLLLDAVQDHIKNNGKNIERDTQLVKISKFILNIKYNNDKITWFDIYDIVITPSLEYKSESNSTKISENSNYNSIFHRDNIKSSHTREFHNTSEKIFELIDSNQITEITDKSNLDFNILNHTINLKKGLIYTNIEDRDYELEIQISDTINPLFTVLSYEDEIWVKKKLENWLKLYINAESTLCNQNNDESDIARYINSK